MSKEAMRLALGKIKSARDCHPNAVDTLLFEAEEILETELAEQPAQQEPVLQDIEQYRLQMAGISTAAIGYWKESDGILPDYDTIALRDVAKLYAKYAELYRAQRKPLTDEEWQEIADTLGCFITRSQKEIIEAKLKEKNT